MGKVEKWVVLGVLTLIIGILVVSLTVDDPLKKDSVVMANGPDSAPPITPILARGNEGKTAAAPMETAKPAAGAPSALLNSSIDTAAPEAQPIAPAPAIPPDSILKTTDGLQPSYMTDMKFYTWKAGDTFPILAQRFYGDLARLATLRRVNEGKTDVQPGDRILIPVYDLDSTPPVAAHSTAQVAGPTASSPPVKTEKTAKAPAAAVASPRSHIVQEGESLWRIARQELGSGARWNEIYEANRDVLSSPEALRTGQKLRIP
jgi:nucleoid-associated protein YgaU